MDLAQIRGLVSVDMAAVNQIVCKKLASDVGLIGDLGTYIVDSGGKRLRPLLLLLAAHACRYEGRQHLNLAAVIEFIHTATLLHDDVVDTSELRRGRKTANAIWGNQTSVLVGDFLYSRSFQMMVETNSMRVMDILSNTTNTIAEGEVLQLVQAHDAGTTEAKYMDVIRRKTAKLFEAAAQLGAVLGKQPESVEHAMINYGLHLGTAFQLIDDVLDYSADPLKTGKNLGDDLAEGKPTLPLIHALNKGSRDHVDLVRSAIENGGRENISGVRNAIESTNAIAYTARVARREADAAIQALAPVPETKYKEALYALAEFSV
ncbi:MAG: polyprenyl synthetase family protein, partial [Gammaproteobacteria bacterium]